MKNKLMFGTILLCVGVMLLTISLELKYGSSSISNDTTKPGILHEIGGR